MRVELPVKILVKWSPGHKSKVCLVASLLHESCPHSEVAHESWQTHAGMHTISGPIMAETHPQGASKGLWTLKVPVFMKIIGHIGHFRWLGPNVWWEISQISIEYIKPIRQMSDESWKFFKYTEVPHKNWGNHQYCTFQMMLADQGKCSNHY